MSKKKNETSGYANLMNLKTKPSDFRPRFHEQQIAIDDLIPGPKYNETLVIRCNACIPLQDIAFHHREFVNQRKKGVILLPPGFEVLGYCPSDTEIKVVDDSDDAEKFIDDFLEGKYDK